MVDLKQFQLCSEIGVRQHAVSNDIVAPQYQRLAADPSPRKRAALGIDPAKKDANGLHESAGIRPLCRPAALTGDTSA